MQKYNSMLPLAGLALAGLLAIGASEPSRAAGTVGGSYQDMRGKVCPEALSCTLNLTAMQFSTRLASVSCNLLIDHGTTDHQFVIKEWFLGQSGRQGGLVYLAPLRTTSLNNGQAAIQVAISQPNYGVAQGNKPYIKILFHRPIAAEMTCSIIGKAD